MKLNLTGKTALITGSSAGIGYGIAKFLHEEGCKVALNGRSEDTLSRAVASLPGAIGVAGDVSRPYVAKRVISDAIEGLGGVEILVCNVGSGASVPPGEEHFEEWQRVFALNLWSTTNVVEAAKTELIANKGVIVCISSICGQEYVADAPVTYSAAKAALNAYVRGMSRPLGRRGVRINGISPGNILTDNSVWSRKLSENYELLQSALEKNVSLQRLGSPSEIGSLVAYLASSHSAFATGSIWTLDGGQVHS